MTYGLVLIHGPRVVHPWSVQSSSYNRPLKGNYIGDIGVWFHWDLNPEPSACKANWWWSLHSRTTPVFELTCENVCTDNEAHGNILMKPHFASHPRAGLVSVYHNMTPHFQYHCYFHGDSRSADVCQGVYISQATCHCAPVYEQGLSSSA